MKTKQNKLGSYLAVTVGAGCAASVAEGQIQVVDLSGISTSFGGFAFPSSTGDSADDLNILSGDFGGYLGIATDTNFFSDLPGDGGDFARGYQAGVAAFPADPDGFATWRALSGPPTGGGFLPGLNYVAFQDSADNFGWLSFTLTSLTVNSTSPISSFGHFVYDDTSTSPANAIALETAIAAVPEPSSLALLALGATGLVTRRQRKKAA